MNSPKARLRWEAYQRMARIYKKLGRAMEKMNPVQKMSDLELYEFDLRGVIVLRNALSRDSVDRVNAIIERAQGQDSYHKFSCLDLDPLFLDLITDGRIVGICSQLCGPFYRLDHEYCIQENPRKERLMTANVHGGPWQDDGTSMYGWFGGEPKCNQIVVGFNLYPANKGDGGLVFLPGSHKSNVPIHGGDLTRMLGGRPEDCASWHCFEAPELGIGDVLVFTEALIHGTVEWRPADRPRRILYYRFCPGHSAWRDYESQRKYATLARNDLERRLLNGPYVGDFEGRPKNKPLHPSWRPRTVE